MKLYKKQLRPMIVSDGVQGCATTKTPLLPEHIWFDEESVTDTDKLIWEKTIKDKDSYASLSMECRYSEVEDIKKETVNNEILRTIVFNYFTPEDLLTISTALASSVNDYERAIGLVYGAGVQKAIREEQKSLIKLSEKSEKLSDLINEYKNEYMG